jgi:excisionase family DNA binding protein
MEMCGVITCRHMSTEFQILDIRGAAERTGLPVSTVRWHVNKKHLPTVKLFGRHVLSAATVDEFAKNRLAGFGRSGRPKKVSD